MTAVPPTVSVLQVATNGNAAGGGTWSDNLSSTTAPLNNVDLKAVIGGVVTGNYKYNFDCGNETTYTSPWTTRGFYVAVDKCNYNAGTYTAKVSVTRDGLTSIPALATVKVANAMGCGSSANQDFCDKPSSNLCVNGVSASGVTTQGSSFIWTCDSGATPCSAVKHCLMDGVWREE